MWSRLYDIIGRGCSCPAGLFAGRAVWSSKCSLKFTQSHEDRVKMSSERLISGEISPFGSATGLGALVLSCTVVHDIGDKLQSCWRSDA